LLLICLPGWCLYAEPLALDATSRAHPPISNMAVRTRLAREVTLEAQGQRISAADNVRHRLFYQT
jgi:hypothetical protein